MHFSALLRSSLLVAGLVAPWLVAANDDAPSDVTSLTAETFDAFAEAEGLHLIEFFAPWCGHCKALAPHYEEAATALKEKNIRLAKVDCVDNADLCQSHGIQGYPTLKIYKGGKESAYSGPRKADGIISYMIKQSLPAVSEVTSANHDEFTKADKLVVVAYLSKTDDAPAPAFSAAADTHRDDYLFGLTTDEAAIKAAGVTPPAVVLYKKFDEGRNDLPAAEVAEATAGSITAFIKENAMPLLDEVSGDNYQLYSATGLPLVYLFVDPEDKTAHAALLKEIAPIAAQHKGKVNFVWIDAVKFVEHGKQLGLKEGQWPAVILQELKTQHKYPLDQSLEVNFANVEAHVAKYVAGELEPTLKSQPIPTEQTEKYYTLVGKAFDDVVYDDAKDVLVQFSAPWCGHCKRLLPIYEELAESFKGNADTLIIAKMDATENDLPTTAPFQITGFPTLKFKPAGSKQFVDYEGDRTLDDLITFVEKWAKHPVKAVKPAPPVAEEEAPQTPVEEVVKPVVQEEQVVIEEVHDEL